MKIQVFQVDAFASELFEGNPAAVCPLEEWPEDEVLQNIAMENNLSETAFFVRNLHDYELRWFTPKVEVALCGHATLATAHVLFHHLGSTKNPLIFKTRKSGELQVKKDKGLLTLNFPADKLEPALPPKGLIEALGKKPEEIWKGKTDYLLYYPAQEDIEEMAPDFFRLANVEARGVIVTAPGYESDFVSRFFAPAVGVNEDPVTGSAHTSLTPFWAHRMNQLEFDALQLSERGGKLRCHLSGDRVLISGQAKTFLEGTITL
ncbi:PhzF family phenazine biosynthesis protein [Prolixibacter sp. NT017]|uniref:PhzF family phenazine biosynthesis protein n=1 Tax=Prolixibacter sp. NT017 TaxID=2652390 RepID=UPI00127364D0|nr:PhzF family phenazine biosynthesis protein [Prolixibacter sp. NT017]GET24242.1 putative isomerase [Prolixibacter sp. NT017]